MSNVLEDYFVEQLKIMTGYMTLASVLEVAREYYSYGWISEEVIDLIPTWYVPVSADPPQDSNETENETENDSESDNEEEE